MYVMSEGYALPHNVMSLTLYRERKRSAGRLGVQVQGAATGAPPAPPDEGEDDEIPNEPADK